MAVHGRTTRTRYQLKTNALRASGVLDPALFTEVMAGLRQKEKQLPCKLFYDEAGAVLFERICTLPEYYPTRTELEILRTRGPEMAAWIGPRARIIEFGSGSGGKTRVLLGHLTDATEYVPIDISESQLLAFTGALEISMPGLRVRPVCADYTQALQLPGAEEQFERTIVFFPGSTVGNFEPAQAAAFLRNAAKVCGAGGGLLIGIDLRKERVVLEHAYNDAAGVTAAFNLNMLTHINRICDADFDIGSFVHRAIYDEARGRIEMHLVSCKRQWVTLAQDSMRAQRVPFAAGEHILTEYSYKYDIIGFQELARAAGFTPHAVWTDAKNLFSVHAFDVV